MLVVVLAWIVVSLHGVGAYQAILGSRLSVWCQRAIYGLAISLGGLLAVAYAWKASEGLSRTIVGLAFLGSIIALCGARFVVHRRMLAAFRAGRDVEPVILVGQPTHALSLSRHLKRHPELGLKPAAIVSGEIEAIEGQTQTTVLNGSLDDLAMLVERHQANRVIICGALGDQSTILRCLQLLEASSVEIHYAPDYSSVPIFLFRANGFAGRPIIDLTGTPWSDGDRMVKWLEDKLLSILILILISPILVLVAVLIKLTSPGPVFFVQARDGLNGRTFPIYKFRTMRVDGPATNVRTPLPEVPEQLAIESDEFDIFDPAMVGNESQVRRERVFVQAKPNDPRVTWLGRILRNTSIDELPQFWNVLRGDMSIVGPRPHAVAHNRQYVSSIAELMRRHHVKPGITGLAQISGARGQTPNTQAMRDRLRFDLEYIHTWSLWLDIKIILMTICKGFYNRQP